MGADRYHWDLASDGETRYRAMQADDMIELDRLREVLAGVRRLREALAGPHAELLTVHDLRKAVLAELYILVAHGTGDGDP